MAQAASPPGRSGLSRDATELEVELAARAGDPFDCDVLIIGSGYGGAVAAARLAGATETAEGGRPSRIWLVERGVEHLPGQFPSRFSELPGHVRFSMQNGEPARGRDEGLFDFRLGPDVCVLLGNGLGGGSLINAGVMAEPEAAVFEGEAWPKEITEDDSLQRGYAKARAMLMPEPTPEERLTRKFRMLESMAKAQGPEEVERCAITINNTGAAFTNAAGVSLQSCTRCGDCLTGCNQGAKGSLDTNYLAHAWRRGAVMFAGASVLSIEPLADSTAEPRWQVRWSYTDRQLREAQPQPGAIRARRVVLAAGSLGSTEILLRSRAALGLTGEQLGKRFSMNGDSIAAGVGHLERVGIVADQESDPADPAERAVGPTITGMVRVLAAPPRTDGGLGRPAFVVQEFAVPAALRQVLGEVTRMRNPFGLDPAELDPGLPLSADPFATYDDAIERTSLFGMMGDDGAHGLIRLPDPPPFDRGNRPAAEGGSSIAWSAMDRPRRLSDAATGWLAKAAAVDVVASHKLLQSAAPMMTVHPLGGCAMAERGSEGVVNTIGQLFRSQDKDVHATFAVLDGSIVPSALGINPAFTIAALAERAVPKLMQGWQLVAAPETLDGRQLLPKLPARPGPVRRRELPPAETTWGVRERLQGLCQTSGRPCWAQLEIEFDPVPGFSKALQLNRRVIKVRRAELELRECEPGADEFTLCEESIAEGVDATRCWKVSLAGTVELFALQTPGEDDSPADQPSQLVYRLAVQSTSSAGLPADAAMPAGWRVGARLVGVKTVRVTEGTERSRSPWRELSEMEMSLDGQPIGRWALDLADLAQRREPLLSVLSLATMPDALADLGSLGLYVLRRLWQRLPLKEQIPQTDLAQLTQRWPGAYVKSGKTPSVIQRDEEGWRLTRYAGEGTPVVLIHGLGASGSSFTHPSIERNLARCLHESGRDVWVLDVRSSIANEAWRKSSGAAKVTVEEVALGDLPAAIEQVCSETGHGKVDVVAHCMGAVMFVLATLGHARLGRERIRSAVLSQVGPLVRLSPLNQLRGHFGSYIQEFLQVQELDATPDVRSNVQGQWEHVPRGGPGLLLDAALATFPYPDDDDEASVGSGQGLAGTAFTYIRHRADAIFGQLFELDQMAPEVLAHLAALFGWVKVPMLTQAIHFARQEMLTDARGRNAFLSPDRIEQRFAFPLLLLHGRRNRLFDWRGGLRSLRLLRRMRGQDGPLAEPPCVEGRWHYAEGERTQLVVFEKYGHMDCMVGREAHRDVFPTILKFLHDADAVTIGPVQPGNQRERDIEAPWVGPILGALRVHPPERSGRGRRIEARVLVHPTLRRRQTHGFVVVPVRRTAAGLEPDLRNAAWRHWPGRTALVPRGQGLGKDARVAAVQLVIDENWLPVLGDTFALLTVHKPYAPQGDLEATTSPAWLEDASGLYREVAAAVKLWVEQALQRSQLDACLFSLPQKAIRAADDGTFADSTPRLSFALTSCQYPPGLLDRGPAQASLRRLSASADAADGPQFLLLAGDQVYADATAGVFDAGAGTSDGGMHLAARFDRIYELNWGLPAFRRLASRLPVYPMLDDHEVRDNWQGLRTPASRAELQAEQEEALLAFDRFQGVLVPPEGRGTRLSSGSASRSYVVRPAGVPLFVLDTRTRRTQRSASSINEASILDDGDFAALLKGLKEAPAEVVKLVMTPVPLLPPERLVLAPLAQRMRSDSWSGFPGSTGRLLGFIRDENIRRVVLLSGDSHLSSVTSFDFDGRAGRSVVSIVSSGSYAPWPFANQKPDELLLSGAIKLGTEAEPVHGTVNLHALSATNGHALIHLQPTSGGRVELQVSLRGGDGSNADCRLEIE